MKKLAAFDEKPPRVGNGNAPTALPRTEEPAPRRTPTRGKKNARRRSSNGTAALPGLLKNPFPPPTNPFPPPTPAQASKNPFKKI